MKCINCGKKFNRPKDGKGYQRFWRALNSLCRYGSHKIRQRYPSSRKAYQEVLENNGGGTFTCSAACDSAIRRRF